MRDGLRNLYSVIKGQDAHIKFAMLTGVSKFSKVNIFSGLNNLMDITLSPDFSAICGYTDADVDTVFAPELEGLDRDEIRHWYNGYNWRGEAVYNPFGLLLLFQEREFRSFWFETGTPTFLVDMLTERKVYLPALQKVKASSRLRSRRYFHRSPDVPVRLSDHCRGEKSKRQHRVYAGVSKSGSSGSADG
jgi:hypothetical protein